MVATSRQLLMDDGTKRGEEFGEACEIQAFLGCGEKKKKKLLQIQVVLWIDSDWGWGYYS